MNEPTVIARLKQLILKNRAKPPRSFECGGFVVLMRWVIMCPAAGNLNLRLAAFDLCGGGVSPLYF